MKNEVSFDVCPGDSHLIGLIVQRAMSEGSKGIDRLALEMDITACHANGNKLRLMALLNADSFNFWHDVGGIARHLNRETGQLEDCFSPRFSG
jgi:hypothetical protein